VALRQMKQLTSSLTSGSLLEGGDGVPDSSFFLLFQGGTDSDSDADN